MISAQVRYDTKTTQHFRFANIGSSNLYIKHGTECETVAKIQDTQVATVRSSDSV